MSKENTDKINKEHNFDIFKNYKCDGQLVMNFNGTEIEIVEEEKVNKTANHWI